jgi:hypothetical protein
MRLFRKLGKDTVALLLLGMADVRAIRGPAASDIYRRNFCHWARDGIVKLEKTILPLTRQAPLINGRDLIALGMSPGPELGTVLTRITTARDNGQITTRDEALALACELLKDEASRT